MNLRTATGDAPGATAPRARRGHRAAQRGLGIIEVLVALVVVSLGVLGVAGLQLTGMKHSAGSLYRSQALVLAEDMAERMRLNAPAVASGDYHSPSATPDCATPPTPYCEARAGGAAAAICGAADLAAFDLWTVRCGTPRASAASGQGVRGALPDGRLAVVCDDAPCTADSTWTISVGWNESRTVVADPETADPDAVDARRVQMRLRP